MRIKSFIASIVITAVATVTIAPAARAADNPVAPSSTTAAAGIDFQQAIARAAAQHAATPEISVAVVEQVNHAAMQGNYPPGGGGGHLAMVMSIVGTVVGIGMTYYVIKATQKALKNSQQGQ